MNKKSLIKIISLLTIVCLNWSGISGIGSTFTYFSDIETLNNNTFSVGTLDFSLRSGQNNFTPDAENMKPGERVNRYIYIGKTADSSPLKHKVSFELVSGNLDLCDQLGLKIWYDHYKCQGSYADCRDMRLAYNGKLSALDKYTNTDFIIPHPDDKFDTNPSDGTEQWFYYSISLPSEIDYSFQGEVCNFNFVYEAWQTNFPDSSQGFTDEEKLESTIKAGYWNPPVVLNEFLPNDGNYPEFIEIYNKTASPIDLDGFYIKANGNIVPINATTTSAYSSGSTIIPANGWLVVTTGGGILDDTSGTVTLYNQNDVEVDSYTYDASDYNVNNTPGWTNNLVRYWPFDGDLGDKSGNGNNGTNYGATFTTGKINQALSFDGMDDYVSIADDDIFDFGSGEFSIESWIKTTSALRQWTATRYKYYGPGWGLGTQNGHALGYIRTLESGTGKREIEGVVNVSDGDWHHIVIIRTGDKIKLYTDGAFEREGTLAGNVNDDEPIEVGRISFEGGSQYISGLIDEVKIYNRALDATEILEHYSDVGPSGAVPSDKSYARIPDGIGYWVDPIPTPGGPNILESETINQEEVIEEEPIVEEEPIAEELPVEETPVAEEEPVSEGEPVIEEEPSLEKENPPVEEEPSITEEAEPPVEEPPAEEEVTTEENQEEGGILEKINEIIDEVINEIVGEIIPDEPADEEISTEDTQVIDETAIIEEVPTTEEPIIEEEPVVEDSAGEEAPVTEETTNEAIIDGTASEVAGGVVEETVSEPEAPVVEETPIIEEAPTEEAPVIEEQPVVAPDDSSSTQGSTGESGSDSAGDTADDAGDTISE